MDAKYEVQLSRWDNKAVHSHGSQSQAVPQLFHSLFTRYTRHRAHSDRIGFATRTSKSKSKSSSSDSRHEDLALWRAILHSRSSFEFIISPPRLHNTHTRIAAWKTHNNCCQSRTTRSTQTSRSSKSECKYRLQQINQIVEVLAQSTQSAPTSRTPSNRARKSTPPSFVHSDDYTLYATAATTSEMARSKVSEVSSGSSSLSSPPSQLDTTPDSFQASSSSGNNVQPNVITTRGGSPMRCSTRTKLPNKRFSQAEDGQVQPNPKRCKRTQSSTHNQSNAESAHAAESSVSEIKGHSIAPTFSVLSDDISLGSPPTGLSALNARVDQGIEKGGPSGRVKLLAPNESKRTKPARSSKHNNNKETEQSIKASFFAKANNKDFKSKFKPKAIEKNFDHLPQTKYDQTANEFRDRKSDQFYPGFDRNSSIYYHADGFTRQTASHAGQNDSNPGSDAPSPSAGGSKANNANKAHNSGPGKGGKSKGRGGAGRDRDSPDPPHKAALSHHEKSALATIRARQAELRKFFAIVATQQRDALDLLAKRDLAKLHKKPKAHLRVSSYHELLDDLQATEDRARSLAIIRRGLAIEHAIKGMEAEKGAAEARFRTQVEDAQQEHIAGAQGDLMLFHKAFRGARDQTGTEHGSDVEIDAPRYHELPEPYSHVRGYTSSQITDEKPFKQHQTYDEQAQRDVMDDDVVGPVLQSDADEIAKRKADGEHEARQRMEPLIGVAEDELMQFSGYLVPRPLRPNENPQFALSRLADCAEYISRRHPDRAHTYIPVAPEDMSSFPRRHFQRMPPPMLREQLLPLAPQAVSHPQQSGSVHRRSLSRKQKPILTPCKRPLKDEEAQSGSSSNNSTPLQAIAPAPTRLQPPSGPMQHHHHQMPPAQMPPPPSNVVPQALPISRGPSLTPLNTRVLHSSPPATPTYQAPPTPPNFPQPPPSPGYYRQGPPPPSPLAPPLPAKNTFSGPQPPVPLSPFRPQRPSQPTPSSQQSPPQPPPLPQQPEGSPVRQTQPPPAQLPIHRYNPNTESPRIHSAIIRPSNGRRGSGNITFTPAQTPTSARFTRPPVPPNQPPGQSVIRPNQFLITNKITNNFVNQASDSRAQALADSARQNAARNEQKGAGPKGGSRVLLPKKPY